MSYRGSESNKEATTLLLPSCAMFYITIGIVCVQTYPQLMYTAAVTSV